MSTYGRIHELVVEHTDQGEDGSDPQEKGEHQVYLHEVRYILRHPEGDCWDPGEERHECPILVEFENVGVLGALHCEVFKTVNGRYRSVVQHLEDGLWHVQAWAEKHRTAEGEDWDGGLYVERPASDTATARTGEVTWL